MTTATCSFPNCSTVPAPGLRKEVGDPTRCADHQPSAGASGPARAGARPPVATVPALEKLSSGEWRIETDPPKQLEGGGLSFAVGGSRHRNAQTAATIDLYPSPEDLDERIEALAAKRGKATVLVAADGVWGGTQIRVYHGTVFSSGSDIGIMPGRKTRDGRYVRSARDTRVLDVIEATGARDEANKNAETLNRRWHTAGVPDLEPVSIAALSEASEENPVTIVSTFPGIAGYPETRATGTVWTITDYDPESDIASGYLWVPGDAQLTSEFGTVYARELYEAGIAPHANKVDLMEVDDIPGDRAGAYEVFFG